MPESAPPREFDGVEEERGSRKRPCFDDVEEVMDTQASEVTPSATLGVEGSVLAVRECIHQVLSSWWITGKSRRELEAALDHLRYIETELPMQKDEQHNSISNEEKKKKNKSSLEELHEELQVGKTKSVSRRWLVETFTEGHELSASRRSSNVSEVTPISPRSSLKVAASEEAHSERDENELYADIEPTDTADIVVSLSGETEVAELLRGVGRLDCDILGLAELPGIKSHLLEVLFQKAAQHHSLLEKLEDQSAVKEGPLFRSRLPRFLRSIEESYRSDVPYHTAVHASDAMMTMEWLLRSQSLVGQVSAVDHLMALISMAIHDVGHPGRNNLFHSKTLSPLAITYNDKSILENFHVANAFEIMQKDADMNWLALLSTDYVPPGKEKPSNLQQQMRRGMIEIVLGTDMAKHNQHQKSLMSWVANKPTAETPAGEQAFLQDKLELLEVLAHAADISNPCLPHHMMLFWAERVLSEFWLQGDEESRLNLEFSPMCERAVGESSVPKQQIGFLNFVIAPFFQPLAELLPEVQEAVDHMTENRAFWQKKETEQASVTDLFGPRGEA